MAAAVVGVLDAEGQTGMLFSLLHGHCGPTGDSTAPPGLDVNILHGLQIVLAMPHNRALARRAHAEARRVATSGGPMAEAAARAQVFKKRLRSAGCERTCLGCHGSYERFASPYEVFKFHSRLWFAVRLFRISFTRPHHTCIIFFFSSKHVVWRCYCCPRHPNRR